MHTQHSIGRVLAVTLLITQLALALAVSSFAQFGPLNTGRPRGQNFGATGGECMLAGYRGSGLEHTAAPRDIDRSGFVYGRLLYHPVSWWRQQSSGEVPWHHDYPDGDTMLPTALARLTKVYTTPDSFQLIDIADKEIFKYPFVYLSEPGFLNLLPEDAKNLREYLDRGGFLLVDDFRGNERDYSQMENFVGELEKLYPGHGLKTVPPTHPIFHSFFDLDPTNMLPPYRQYNSGDPQFLALMDDRDRIQIMVNFNNDTSEYWQTLDRGLCSIRESGTAVELGVNYVIYAMTH